MGGYWRLGRRLGLGFVCGDAFWGRVRAGALGGKGTLPPTRRACAAPVPAPRDCAQVPVQQESSHAALVGGLLAGPIEAMLLQPTDVCKTRMQLSNTSHGMWATGRSDPSCAARAPECPWAAARAPSPRPRPTARRGGSGAGVRGL